MDSEDATSYQPTMSTRPARKRKVTTRAGEGDSSPPSAPNAKLKLKVKDSVQDLGAVGWDRELDSEPDEPLAVEEHFILRVPQSIAPQLHEAVSKREVADSTWFKFKDSRRAVFHFGDKLFGAKLVDLPTLIESQLMTGSGGHSVKVADISQMLLVDNEVETEGQVVNDRQFNIEDFIYPHGITPPLKHVRKRRFRKRVNKRTIEIVEDAVEKLLEADAMCEESSYDLVDPDMSDDDYNSGGERQANSPGANDSIGAPTPGRGEDDERDLDAQGEDDEEEEEDDEDDDGYDSDLAKQIHDDMEAQNRAQEKEDASGSDSDNDGLFGASSDEEEEEEEEDKAEDPDTLEERRRIKLLGEEVADLTRAITSKEAEFGKAMNPIFKKRFEDIVKKLTSDRDAKRSQQAAAVRDLGRKKDAKDAAAAATLVPAATLTVPLEEASAAPLNASANELADDAMDLS